MQQTRLEVNREILLMLNQLVESNPDLRFSQLIQSFGFVESNNDDFYLESIDLLNRVLDKLK